MFVLVLLQNDLNFPKGEIQPSRVSKCNDLIGSIMTHYEIIDHLYIKVHCIFTSLTPLHACLLLKTPKNYYLLRMPL